MNELKFTYPNVAIDNLVWGYPSPNKVYWVIGLFESPKFQKQDIPVIIDKLAARASEMGFGTAEAGIVWYLWENRLYLFYNPLLAEGVHVFSMTAEGELVICRDVPIFAAVFDKEQNDDY